MSLWACFRLASLLTVVRVANCWVKVWEVRWNVAERWSSLGTWSNVEAKKNKFWRACSIFGETMTRVRDAWPMVGKTIDTRADELPEVSLYVCAHQKLQTKYDRCFYPLGCWAASWSIGLNWNRQLINESQLCWSKLIGDDKIRRKGCSGLRMS